MTDNTKICMACKVSKPYSEFYMRGIYPTSECKTCMKARNKTRKIVPKTQSLVESEKLVIAKLNSLGIPAYPGKAMSHAHVDVVAWGLVNIEVKYSIPKNRIYSFLTTPSQRENGFRAHVVVLVCDTKTEVTFHLFGSSDPVFFIDGRMKHAISFAPEVVNHKHERNRVVLTSELMFSARDQWMLIEQHRRRLSMELREAFTPAKVE